VNVNVNTILDYIIEEARDLWLCAQTDWTDIFDFSGISEPRRHFYVYSLLVLWTLMVHTNKSFDPAPQCHLLNTEVARLIEAGEVARNLY